MFEFDVCLCGNGEKCPRRDTCLRYVARKYVKGINTYALFYNENGECEDYYPVNKEVDKNVK